jgi:TolB-like protein/Flp pilus assembly protein TadD
MLTGQTPFRGSPTEMMDLHQREPLPLEQVKDVPQPVIALLEVLLEKDPSRRLQSPANLLNALPKVTNAVKARRTISHQSLREIEAEPLGASGKVIAILTKLRDVLRSGRVRQYLWVALLISGGALLAVNFFFAGKAPNPQASKSSSPAITAPEKSIAVLPFESLSENKSDSYFADGVQDEILSNLAKVHQLTVISRTSVMTYRSGNNRNLRSIANDLGVVNVVEGTVRRDGNRVRVTTELVDARTDQTLWSDSYDRDLTDIFAIQSEIAQTVASKLSAQLSPEERTDIQRKPTEDLEAYDLYLKGKAIVSDAEVNFSWENERELALNAIRLLEEATRKDPKLALAYCSLAKAHDLLLFYHLDVTPERRALGDAAVNEALRLQPDLPEAHLASAVHLVAGYRDYEKARVQIAIAERGLPNSAEVFWYRADVDVRQGRYEESIGRFERAAILDPRNPKILLDLQAVLIKLRRFREDEQTIDRLMKLEPDEQGLKVWKAYDAMGEKANLQNFLNVLETLPAALKDRADIISSRFQAAVFARDWTNAEEILDHSANEEFAFTDTPGAKVPRKCLEIWLARLRGRNPATEVRFTADRDQLKRNVEAHPEDAVLLSMLGIIDAALGRKEEAIQEARRAVEMLPVSEDGETGPSLISNLAVVYALTNEPNLAFEELNVSVGITGGVDYGELKLDPAWDPLRTDPRFDRLLAQLAPKE